MNYVNCNKKDLEKEYAALVAEYEEVKGKGLKLNMAVTTVSLQALTSAKTFLRRFLMQIRQM